VSKTAGALRSLMEAKYVPRPAPDAPALMRSYSLSGEPSAERYRASIKREAFGAAGANIDEKLQVGDVLDTSAACGNFTLRLHAAQPAREHARSAWRRGSGVGLSAQGFRGLISARPH
jgi:hypothetical protein